MGKLFNVLVVLGRLACLRLVGQRPMLLDRRGFLDIAQNGQFRLTIFVFLGYSGLLRLVQAKGS